MCAVFILILFNMRNGWLFFIFPCLQEVQSARRWEGGDAHYNFAIYAAGRAYVPDIVDNLLCQVSEVE